MIKVIVNGAKGRMGQEAVIAVEQDPNLTLVAQTTGTDDLAQMIHHTNADVVIDFTKPETVYSNTKLILDNGAHPVIGTTGLLPLQIKELQALAKAKRIGGIIAPNFSLAAVLMMKYAKDAAQYFSNVEIIELHHDKKVDAPSGTALKTAQMIDESFTQKPAQREEKELLLGARGAKHQDIHIHSIRLPGFLAHQEVLFGAPGETFSLRYDSISRSAYMPGVCLSCKKVMELQELVYGLECIL